MANMTSHTRDEDDKMCKLFSRQMCEQSDGRNRQQINTQLKRMVSVTQALSFQNRLDLETRPDGLVLSRVADLHI